MMKKTSIMVVVMLATHFMYAQIAMPQPSPLSTITQKIGLVDASIVYSRPSAKGRKIFGDLVPYDKMWRTGANKATKLTFSDSVSIAGHPVPKGDYALFAIPGKSEWTIIISKQSELSGTSGYKESEDACRFKIKPYTVPAVETFTIGFSNLTIQSADIEILWETTAIKFSVATNPDKQVMKNIDAALQIPARNYYQAATYYLENNKDMSKALSWINAAIDGGYERYWVLRTKALIQAEIGDYTGAIETARKSSEMAQKDGDDTYVKMNDASILEWSKKKNK